MYVVIGRGGGGGWGVGEGVVVMGNVFLLFTNNRRKSFRT